MLTMEFDYNKLAEALRPILREEVQSFMKGSSKHHELPPLLTRKDLMELFHIGPTKAAELLARQDFPVMREAGVLIPTEKLFVWIDRHTRWIEDNTKFFQVG